MSTHGRINHMPELRFAATKKLLRVSARQIQAFKSTSSAKESLISWRARKDFGSGRTCRCRGADTAVPSTEGADALNPVRGKVVYVGNSLAIVGKLNEGAPIGATILFESGATGRPAGECFVAIVSNADSVKAGHTAECIILGIKDRFEEEVIYEYEKLSLEAGDQLRGCVVDFMCNVQRRVAPAGQSNTEESSSEPVGSRMPVLGDQVPLADREVISEPLFTGLKEVDVIAPLARGQAMLLAGPQRSQQSRAMLAMLGNQAGSEVRVIYASTGQSPEVLDGFVQQLLDAGVMPQCTVVAAPADASLGAQYAALCAALTLGEDIRNRGQHAFVALDSMESAVRLWDCATQNATAISQQASEDGNGAMVELNGMLVSAAAAQRRQFFSALIQRAAKMRSSLGGGSLTLLIALPGVPATGQRRVSGVAAAMQPTMDKYKHLSPELKAKLAAALKAQAAGQTSHIGKIVWLFADTTNHTRTEIIEECMSIADGQIVLNQSTDSTTIPRLDVAQSLSRMGTRAYYPAVKDLAPKVRLELTQVSDAAKFSGGMLDSSQQHSGRRAKLVEALLAQSWDVRVGMAELACMLCTLNAGLFDDCEPSQAQDYWQRMWSQIQQDANGAVQHINETKILVAESRRKVLDACLLQQEVREA